MPRRWSHVLGSGGVAFSFFKMDVTEKSSWVNSILNISWPFLPKTAPRSKHTNRDSSSTQSTQDKLVVNPAIKGLKSNYDTRARDPRLREF